MSNTLQLFLGFPLDGLFEEHLQKSSPPMVALFTKGGDYLSPLTIKNQKYLGKFPSPHSTMEELECLEANLLSLLRRIAPRYPFEGSFPHLLAITI